MEKLSEISFRQVYISHFYRMKRFAKEYVMLDEDAENIVHNVFLELWEKREIIGLPINLNAFLFTVTKNKCYNHLKHKKVIWEAATKMREEQKLALQMKFESLKAFDDDLFAEESVEKILERVVSSLPEKCREIFIKSRLEGKKHKDIASELNISVNTIETQMGIAYKKLRSELKDYLPLLVFLTIG